ncbi:MAG: SRPBCC domain-containing protein [Paludibacter sp.]|nr:SRPBCC domain-containing protein [Paludibacter sp.]
MTDTTVITVKTIINKPLDESWELFTESRYITKWYFASADWYCRRAENDLCGGGRFTYRMEARDGSFGFDFSGNYDEVILENKIAITLDDNRKVEIWFVEEGEKTYITEKFEPENENPLELQQQGWQAILDNFKAFAESIQN